MKKTISVSIMMALAAEAFAQLDFSGNEYQPVIDTPAVSSGLDAVYVFAELNGVSASYRSASSNYVRWYRFSNLGGGYAEEITGIRHEGNITVLPMIEPDMGYIIEDGNTRHYYWIVDYSAHSLDLESISVDKEDSDCSTVALSFKGNAAPIYYYTINGQRQELSRGLELRYSTLEYVADNDTYTFVDRDTEVEHITGSVRVAAPLCNTDFTLSGDRFLKSWGIARSVTSGYYEAAAVEAHTTADQMVRDNDNEQSSGDVSSLGGSAPAEINFHAVATDAAIFREWQIASDPEFNFIEYRDNNFDMDYVFRNEGMFYVRFMASNAAGTCDWYSPSYEVSIGESDIKCPNAFSPGASEGVNDEWKVSYKSIIDFECHIFNRWGVQVCHFSDPSQGWDGKYNGKLVPAGVYYYIIKAHGADGKEYNLKGDINIINYRLNNGSLDNNVTD